MQFVQALTIAQINLSKLHHRLNLPEGDVSPQICSPVGRGWGGLAAARLQRTRVVLVVMGCKQPTWKQSSESISEELVGVRRRGVGEVQVRSEVSKVGRVGWGRLVELRVEAAR